MNSDFYLVPETNPPGGVLFWNSNGADLEKLKETIQAYSVQAKKLGLKPIPALCLLFHKSS